MQHSRLGQYVVARGDRAHVFYLALRWSFDSNILLFLLLICIFFPQHNHVLCRLHIWQAPFTCFINKSCFIYRLIILSDGELNHHYHHRHRRRRHYHHNCFNHDLILLNRLHYPQLSPLSSSFQSSSQLFNAPAAGHKTAVTLISWWSRRGMLQCEGRGTRLGPGSSNSRGQGAVTRKGGRVDWPQTVSSLIWWREEYLLLRNTVIHWTF